jgi:outer membrane protein assembly factor BamB
LVRDGLVTVFAGGPKNKAMLAYKAETGDLAWAAGQGTHSYCSPHPATIDGVEQILIATDAGMSSFHPTKGDVLWHHDWKGPEGFFRVVQPVQVDDSDFLLGTWMGLGLRRFHVAHTQGKWDADKSLWTNKKVQPYYNDLVAHKGHAYGISDNFLVCVNLDDGKVRWKERGYGYGQLLLLPDQDLLLVLSETGEAALVKTDPEALDDEREVGKFQALEGKTWNHPVVAHGRLYVRNGEWAACFQLAPEGPTAQAE